MDNLTIFDMMYEDYKITKPIRLIEFFAGYGSQAFALKYLGVPFEHWRICEWAVPSIQAYKDAHFTNDNEDYSKQLSKEYIIEFLHDKGISMDYNEPMKLNQIKRLSEETLRKIYNNIRTTHNLVNIQNTQGIDLEIVDKDKYAYVLTYSFPCQDLSLAGKGKGMSRDGGTRSGMLWEVERILDECNSLNCLPQVLLMENVPQVIGTNNIKDFQSWREKLESLGYSNYIEVLNAKYYGIPQNRERAFMVSILGEYNYTFPKRIPLDKKLKDMLEKNVDEKYYLSDKMIQGMINTNFESYKLENKLLDENGCANTIIARFDGTPQCVEVKENNLKTKLCNELITSGKVKENDVIRHSYSTSRMQEWENRNIEQNNISPTLDTRCDCLGICVNDEYLGTYEYAKSDNFMQGKDRFFENKEISGTILASGNHNGVVIRDEPKILGGLGEKKSNGGTQWYQQDRIYDDNVALAVTTVCNPYYKNGLRIRKLTPKECFRLMGVKDEDYENIAKNQSNSKLYHLAGDSIVVNVLMGIFKEMM